MSDVQTFGQLVTRKQVTDAATLTLQSWFPRYAGWLTRQITLPGGLPVPNSYVVSNDPNHWPEDQPPAVVVSCPGTLGDPKMSGARMYRTFWDVRVTVFVSGPDRESTDDLATYYGAAVRAIFLQKPDLGGLASGVTWHGEQYHVRVSDRDQRTLGSCSNSFAVDVRDVVRALGGPSDPTVDPSVPPAAWPTVQTVIVNIAPE